MPQRPAGGRRPGAARSHHIDNIAHLFFAEGGTAPVRPTRLAVAALGAGRAAAFACAGLVAGCRALAGGGGPAVDWCEDPAVMWSAGTYLDAPDPDDPSDGYPREARPEPRPAPEAGAVRWDHLGALDRTALARLEGWAGARAAAPAAWPAEGPRPGRDGLAVALCAGEIGRWETALGLGRLLGLLRPRRLELLVFPRAWAPEAGRGGGAPDAADWARALAVRVGTDGPVNVVADLPPPGPAAGRLAGPVLQGVAARLVADFEVDRDPGRP